MEKPKVAQLIGIFANLGVLIGIVFLATEVRQNNSLLTAQSAYAQLNAKIESRARIVDNTNDFAELFMRYNSGGELSPTERMRLNFFAHEILDIFRWQFSELQAGRLPDDYIDLRTWHDQWDHVPSLPELFEEDRPRLNEDFVQFIEDNVINR